MKLLNLGCGSRYHEAWTNVDFISHGNDVIAHNLLSGIPFPDNSFDVVYHSHVLEHFTKSDGKKFLMECFRVLKHNGIIRIAVPDLEMIAKEYLKSLELAFQGDENAKNNYEWIKLELFDQMVRNESGGDMAKYIFQPEIPNEEYIYERIGEEGRNLRRTYLKRLGSLGSKKKATANNNVKSYSIKSLFKKILIKSLKMLKGKTSHLPPDLSKEIAIGKFRLGGEIHQWMYDRYSLCGLLTEVGFSQVEVKDGFNSRVDNWNVYELDSKNGKIHKPDSLFMEAIK